MGLAHRTSLTSHYSLAQEAKQTQRPYCGDFAETKLPSMLNHGVNDNDLQLSFGIQSFHIAHLHSPLFQPLSVAIISHSIMKREDNQCKLLKHGLGDT